MLALVAHWGNGIISARWSFATCRRCRFCFRHDPRVFIIKTTVCIIFGRCPGKPSGCPGTCSRGWPMVFAPMRFSKSSRWGLNLRHDSRVIFKQVCIVVAYPKSGLVGPTKRRRWWYHYVRIEFSDFKGLFGLNLAQNFKYDLHWIKAGKKSEEVSQIKAKRRLLTRDHTSNQGLTRAMVSLLMDGTHTHKRPRCESWQSNSKTTFKNPTQL